MQDVLKELIAEFALCEPAVRNCCEPDKAWGRCTELSVLFAGFLYDRGIASELVHLTGTPCFPNEAPRWRELSGDDPVRNHVVVRVGELYIDWTLRQFDLSADVPTIYVDPREKGWTICAIAPFSRTEIKPLR